MYTDEELELAIQEGIFTGDAVDVFRQFVAARRDLPAADEEHFRLITGFNDVFVVIASVLLLVSSVTVANIVHPAFAMFLMAAISWGLAEFFVRKRKMALPAIVLLLAFTGGVFVGVVKLFAETSTPVWLLAAIGAALGTGLHWRRFKVPVTVAAGTAASIGAVIFAVLSVYPNAKDWVLSLMLLSGLAVFTLAMYWDVADPNRTSYKADVAFWLHLLSAPLIIHPVFATLGIFEGSDSTVNIIVVILLYLLMTALSLIIDRRAFMVSALAYVLYALSTLLEAYGFVGESFAITGVVIGFALLLLSGFWHKARGQLILLLPQAIQSRVPLGH